MEDNGGDSKKHPEQPLNIETDDQDVLIEQTSVRQNESEPYRRIFFSKKTQIMVWYENETCEEIYGIQIAFGEYIQNHVIRWMKDKPISYTISDEMKRMESPLLRANGQINIDFFMRRYEPLIIQAPKAVKDLMLNIISELKAGNYVRYPISVNTR
jgi:hypothetical protein